MTDYQAFQTELRRLAFRSRLTPFLAAVWLIVIALIVGSFVAPQPWTSSALDVGTWVIFGVILAVGAKARTNVTRRRQSSTN
ncbi:hypothetical protein C4K88_13260 [Arthrobacter pityocampae]|uniref:Uncharacterized protein n=1 Tax=Arthrobacter pityocampae TaxID=547334 RepID=A0A2S5IVW5_9MICC|nr:hypothetical protein [Arthrobacter pityocampae]PPB48685.1 hypothetical protein C4K88_13260 [Arthrobacter pityocampae]